MLYSSKKFSSSRLELDATGETLRRFRVERTAKAIENDLPLSLGEGAKILLHRVPLSVLDPTTVRDVVTGRRDLELRMEPMCGPGAGARLLADRGFHSCSRAVTLTVDYSLFVNESAESMQYLDSVSINVHHIHQLSSSNIRTSGNSVRISSTITVRRRGSSGSSFSEIKVETEKTVPLSSS
jgi:hypothetical protein